MHHTATTPSYAAASVLPGGRGPALHVTGFQLRDALSLIAPDGTAEQLSAVLCIQAGPERQTARGVEPQGLYCWMSQYPEEGTVRLDETANPDVEQASHGSDAVRVARRLIAAARWLNRNVDFRNLSDAREDAHALANLILRETKPLMDAHMRTLTSIRTEGASR